MKATVRNLLVVTAAVLLAAASLAAQKLPIHTRFVMRSESE